jgi:hypothetical protein
MGWRFEKRERLNVGFVSIDPPSLASVNFHAVNSKLCQPLLLVILLLALPTVYSFYLLIA